MVRSPKADLYVWDPDHTVDWIDNPVNLTIPTGQNFIFISHDPALPNEMISSVKQYRNLGHIFVSQRLLGHYSRVYFYWVQEPKVLEQASGAITPLSGI